MKKFALMAAVVAVAASASFAAPSAHAEPGFNKNMKLSNGPGPGPSPGPVIGPKPAPKPGLSSHPYGQGHGYGHGGYWGGGLAAVGAGLAYAAVASDDDCYYVRRKVLIPGIGVVKRRELVCN